MSVFYVLLIGLILILWFFSLLLGVYLKKNTPVKVENKFKFIDDDTSEII